MTPAEFVEYLEAQTDEGSHVPRSSAADRARALDAIAKAQEERRGQSR